MLKDLKRKDPFYETYVKSSEELTKLRQAHAILISMIKSNQISIKDDDRKAVDNYELLIPAGNQNKYRGGNSLGL